MWARDFLMRVCLVLVIAVAVAIGALLRSLMAIPRGGAVVVDPKSVTTRPRPHFFEKIVLETRDCKSMYVQGRLVHSLRSQAQGTVA